MSETDVNQTETVQKGAIGSLYHSAQISEQNRTTVRDQVIASGPPAEEEKGGLFVSNEIYGRPIDEVDPFVFEDTFCVLSKKFNKIIVYRFSASRSLFIFGPLNTFRRFSVFMITHQLFDLFIVVAILANCIALAFDNNELESFPDPEANSGHIWATHEFNLPAPVELSFLAIYTFEMVVKIISKGLVLNKFSYLRNGWNILDFVVVICGFITEVILRKASNGLHQNATTSKLAHGCSRANSDAKDCPFDLDILRTVRVLRAVKTISILPGLRMMINALLNALVQLFEVMALTLFCLCVFALFALEIYMGKLHQVCVAIQGGDVSKELYRSPKIEPIDPLTPDRHHEWKMWVSNRHHWLSRDFPKDEFVPCGNETGSRHCPEGYVCLPNLGENPDDGWTGFDTFPSAMLSSFQLITLDYWERLYELVMSVVGPWCVPFFIMVVFLGSFYLLNLMLAVVAMSYEAEARSWQKKPLTKHQQLAIHRSDSTFSFADPRHLNVTILTHFKKRTAADRENLARTLRNANESQEIEENHENLTHAVMEALGMNMNMTHSLNIHPTHPTTLTTEEEEGVHEIKPVMSFFDKPRPSQAKRLFERWKSAALIAGSPDHEADLTRDDDNRAQKFQAKAGVALEEDSEIFDHGSHKSHLSNKSSVYFGEFPDDSEVSDEDRLDDDEETEDRSRKQMEETQSGRYSETGSLASVDTIYESDQYSNSTASSGDVDKKRTTIIAKGISKILRYLRYQKRHLAPYVTNNWKFEACITTCIVLNTILLATEHSDQPDYLTDVLSVGGYTFTTIFAFECAFKLCALQGEYFDSKWNMFDLFIACGSFLDTVLEIESLGGLSNAIRGIRLLRIFKLAHSWLTMKILLNIIFSTFGALGNLTLVLAIVIYIFAILGMQIVGQRYIPSNFAADEPDDEAFPRWNFQNFWFAFMMVFRVLCGEWIEPLWDCLRAHSNHEEYRCFLIFLPILILGNFIVLNLFLALLLNSFNTEELNAQREREKENSGKIDHMKVVLRILLDKSRRKTKDTLGSQIIPAGHQINTRPNKDDKNVPISTKRFKDAGRKVIHMNRRVIAEHAILRAETARRKSEASFKRNPMLSSAGRRSQISVKSNVSVGSDSDKKEYIVKPCFPQLCYDWKCIHRRAEWTRWDSARKSSLIFVSNSYFEWGILVLILGSSITLCFEDIYFEENGELKMTLFILNNIFTAFFIIEMMIKWMAMGVYDYFTTAWTLLDAFIVVVGVVTLIYDVQNGNWKISDASRTEIQAIGALKVLRTLRALRPLRAISRWQGMRVVVNALIYAIPSIFNVLLVCLLFWLVFAIMGVQFFKGKFLRCLFTENGSLVNHTLVPDKDACCARDDTSWINFSPNFDNVFQGYLSLLQVATFEGWIELMRAATDAHPVDLNKQNIRDQNMSAYIFFVIFIIVGSFFTLNLFIGVIIDNFNVLKKKYEGNILEVLLTPSQKRYYTAMKKLGRKKPRRLIRRPESQLFGFFYDISMSRKFEIAIFVVIFANMLVMAFERHNQPKIYTNILEGFNSFFSTIYAIEAIVKLLGLRQFYFTVPWNVFDFALVVFSVVDLFLADTELKIPFPPTLLRVGRVFRIGRVLRLIKAAKGIRKLLFALVVSLPALFNIGALLGLITFIYAVLGMALFKDTPTHEAIDALFNFETFGRSTLTLFRLMTAAGWNEVLDALLIEEPVCGKFRKIICGLKGEPECIDRLTAVFYVVTYLIISYLIVINMYIAIILENFVEAHKDEEVGIVEDDLEMFYIRWSKYDPMASQFIMFDQLSDFLSSLEPPLEIPKPNLVAIVSFNLPIAKGNKIHCLDILHALVKHVLGQVDDSEEFRKVQQQMEKKFRRQFPSRKLLEIVSTTRVWKIQHNAAMIIQKAWRAYKKRKNPPLQKARSIQTIRSRASLIMAQMFTRMNSAFQRKQAAGRARLQSFANSLPIYKRRNSMAATGALGSNETLASTRSSRRQTMRE